MTDDKPVVLATTKTFRTLADGGVSITFDIPPKEAARAFALFGLTGTNVGIAPITPEAARQEVQREYIAAEDIEKHEFVQPVPKPENRQFFTSLRPSAQAALLCKQPEFWKFLGGRNLGGMVAHFVGDEADAISAVRLLCRVQSRAELDHNPEKRAYWVQLEAEYWAESHGRH